MDGPCSRFRFWGLTCIWPPTRGSTSSAMLPTVSTAPGRAENAVRVQNGFSGLTHVSVTTDGAGNVYFALNGAEPFTVTPRRWSVVPVSSGFLFVGGHTNALSLDPFGNLWVGDDPSDGGFKFSGSCGAYRLRGWRPCFEKVMGAAGVALFRRNVGVHSTTPILDDLSVPTMAALPRSSGAGQTTIFHTPGAANRCSGLVGGTGPCGNLGFPHTPQAELRIHAIRADSLGNPLCSRRLPICHRSRWTIRDEKL